MSIKTVFEINDIRLFVEYHARQDSISSGMKDVCDLLEYMVEEALACSVDKVSIPPTHIFYRALCFDIERSLERIKQQALERISRKYRWKTGL